SSLVRAWKGGFHLLISDARPPNDGGGGQEIRQRGEGERRPGSSPRPGQDIRPIVPQTEATSGHGSRRTGGPARDRQDPSEQEHETGKARSADTRGDSTRH